jgi:bifunctional non-homologous end joining protein LigD
VQQTVAKRKRYSISKVTGARKSPIPQGLIPMAFQLTPQPFNNDDWQFEIKWDGFRVVSYLEAHKAELKSRKNLSLKKRFGALKEALETLCFDAVLDGEVVLLNESGCADFSGLINSREGCLVYYVFDLLWYNGYSLMELPLYKRREILKAILPASDSIRFSDHVEEKGVSLFEQIKTMKLEGIVAKNRNSLYYPGERTNQWLKIKTEVIQDTVIAGILLDLDKPGSGFNSLIIGVEEEGNYKYIGLLEAGIPKDALVEILSSARATNDCIFSPVPRVNARLPFREPIKNAQVIWLEPTLRCRVKYLELDEYGCMRHGSFRAMIGSSKMKVI